MATPEDRASIGSVLRPRGPVRLALTRSAEPELTVLELEGELDLLTAGRLGTALDREVRHGAGDVVVDLRRTNFVDSAGLHILLNAKRRLTRRSRAMAVVCAPGPVRRTFELAKLTDALGVVSSVREHRWRRREDSGAVLTPGLTTRPDARPDDAA